MGFTSPSAYDSLIQQTLATLSAGSIECLKQMDEQSFFLSEKCHCITTYLLLLGAVSNYTTNIQHQGLVV